MSYSNYTSKMNRRAAAGMAPACISAISETERMINDTRHLFPGFDINVYPLYTEFTLKKDPHILKTISYDTSEDTPVHTRRIRQGKKRSMTYQRHEEPEEYEKRVQANTNKKSSSHVPKRGRITGMSKKSSLRLRKRTARIDDLCLWIDFTFSDDVLENKSITERAEFSYYCLKRIAKYAKDKFGLHLIWKREYQPRKSGKNKGEIMPHFHVLFGGMTPKQHANWINICVQILMRWVQITGTENDDALVVAINKKSYRRIENPKHATCYISKYFSKDGELEIPEGESIGRCWGTSKNCPDIAPWVISLTQEQSFQLVRHLVKKKKLNHKKGRFLKYQLQHGHPTFLFEDEVDIGRFLNFINVDMFPHLNEVPF